MFVQTCGFINLARTGFECKNMWFHQAVSLYLEAIFDQDETTDNQTKLNKYNLKQLICEFVIGSHFEYGKLHSETSKSHFTLPRLLKAYRAHSEPVLARNALSVLCKP